MIHKDLLDYLDELAASGALPYNTARTRKTAVRRLFKYLEESERNRIENVDLEELAKRFQSAEPEVSERSLATYKARVKAVLDSYASENEAGGLKRGSDTARSSSYAFRAKRQGPFIDIPIPLSTGHIVLLKSLPAKIASEDVEKICAVIKAFDGQK